MKHISKFPPTQKLLSNLLCFPFHWVIQSSLPGRADTQKSAGTVFIASCNRIQHLGALTRSWPRAADAPAAQFWACAWVVQDFITLLNMARNWKTYELFVSAIFSVIVSECGWLQITKTAESQTTDKERLLCYSSCPLFRTYYILSTGVNLLRAFKP